MIDLQAQSVQDSHDIINGTLCAGSFSVDLKFTDISTPANELTISGLFDDVALTINPETGFPMIGSKVPIKFHQSDLTIWDGKTSLQRWKIEFTNGASQSMNVEINSIMPDRTFGDIVAMTKIISGHVD